MNKMFRKILCGFFIAAFLGSITWTDLNASVDQTLKAENIIENHIEAVGGREALKKIRNRKTEITLKLLAFGMELKITSFQGRPNKCYAISNATKTAVGGCDGDVVWDVNPMGDPRIIEGEERESRMMDYAFDGPLADWKEYFKSCQLNGVEDVNGKPCYQVVMTTPKAAEWIYFFDKDTFLITKICKIIVKRYI